MKRRAFIKSSMATAASLFFRPGGEVLGANDAISVAVAGFHGHGKSHIRNYLKEKGVRLTALCDADTAVLEAEVRSLKKQGVRVAPFVDIRKLLDRGSIDAVSTATPNHWHSLLTVWACQAEKDVCVEKPVSHNIWEGRKMVEAARRYGRIVQGDLDLRSQPALDEAFTFIHSGALGKILAARGWCYKHRKSIGLTKGKGFIPPTVDYDLWCGPARKGPIDRNMLHYDWHWVWNTGCGELGNNGPHQMDLIRWMLGEKGVPRRTMSFGGRFGYEDAGTTPNTQIAFYDFAKVPVIYEVRGLPSKPGTGQMDTFTARASTGVVLKNKWNLKGPNTGVIIHCEGGYVDLSGRIARDNKGKSIKQFTGKGFGKARNPQANFINAVRSRRRKDCKTDIEEGHLSTCLCHMGNISYRIGQAAKPHEVRERLQDDKDGQEAFGRFCSHLGVHDIDPAETPVTLGPWLTMDVKNERFTGPFSGQANKLIKRQYRAPFVIPEKV